MSNADTTAPLSSPTMINEDAFFSHHLRRLFEGTPREMLCEILQNSQRAGASRVEFSFPQPGRCVVRDNGHGLLGGIEDLYHLLRVVDSRYESESVMIDQGPMGIGIYSIITHPQIRSVRVESNSIALEIDTSLWLDDGRYRNSWPQRVDRFTREQRELRGFCLVIDGEESVIAQMRELLAEDEYRVRDYAWLTSRMCPARGYEGLFEVTLDGEPISTALPAWVALPNAEIADEYQGNLIRISIAGKSNDVLAVLWHGQLIVEWRTRHWQAFLDVRAGRPVNPRAPTRQGLIQDEDLAALYRWMEDRIFAFVCLSSAPKLEHVRRLYAINPARAERECPFAIARRWRPLSENVYESASDVQRVALGREELVRKSDLTQLVFLRDAVAVLLPADHPALEEDVTPGAQPAEEDGDLCVEEFEYGMTSFLRATGLVAYQAVLGCREPSTLWWEPGPPADVYHTTELGRWGIGRGDDEPEQWFPLERGDVYVFNETAPYAVSDITWIIGVTSRDALISFLQRYGRAGWEPSDGNPFDEGDDFEESVDDLIRSYLADTIDASMPLKNLPRALQKFLAEGQDVRQATFAFEFAAAGDWSPCRVRILLPGGGERTLNLY